jgi:hypothetical protein
MEQRGNREGAKYQGGEAWQSRNQIRNPNIEIRNK